MNNTYTIVEDARHGRFLVNPNDTYVGRSIITYGEWGEAEVRLFNKLLRPGDAVVEAGSNIGSHTVPLAKIVGPTGQVTAFEPQRLIFQLLCANLALNDCWNVDTRHAAVGNENGHVLIDRISPEAECNFGGVQLNLGYGASLGHDRVPIMTIDSLGLEQLAFIKADVEGFEQGVIEGARETIARCRPAIYVEHNDLENWAVPELLNSLGYDCYWYITRLFDQHNHRQSTDDIWGTDGRVPCSIDMLALPHGGRWRIGGLQVVSRAQPIATHAMPFDPDGYVALPVVERT